MAKKIITDEQVFKSRVEFQDYVKIRRGPLLRDIDQSPKGTNKGGLIPRYDTGWIARSDWTDVHLGSTATKDTDSNLTHNLNAPLHELLVRVYISTDGTDNNSFEVCGQAYDGGADYGWTAYQVNENVLIIQTGDNGLLVMGTDGATVVYDDEDDYYRVKVWHLG